MTEEQEAKIASMRAHIDAAEAAMKAEKWTDAQIALASVEEASYQLVLWMPKPPSPAFGIQL